MSNPRLMHRASLVLLEVILCSLLCGINSYKVNNGYNITKIRNLIALGYNTLMHMERCLTLFEKGHMTSNIKRLPEQIQNGGQNTLECSWPIVHDGQRQHPHDNMTTNNNCTTIRGTEGISQHGYYLFKLKRGYISHSKVSGAQKGLDKAPDKMAACMKPYHKRLELDKHHQTDNGQQQGNKKLQIPLTVHWAPQWAQVLLASLGKAQVLRDALRMCSTLSAKELKMRGRQLIANIRRYPQIHAEYFDTEIIDLRYLVSLLMRYKNTPASEAMLIILGKANVVRNAVLKCNTLSPVYFIPKGLQLITKYLQINVQDPLPDSMMCILREVLYPHSRCMDSPSPRSLINEASFIEAGIYYELEKVLQLELERHHDHSQKEFEFYNTNLSLQKNLICCTHSEDSEIINANVFSYISASLHHGATKKLSSSMKRLHRCAQEEFKTMCGVM